ncbi:MAG TPA: DNA cytosine methyltransferase [Bacilli bacterium]|nr:DNA cytosine methyltransferase [Bacilli bacterium]
MINIIDLFAGAGGLSEGFRKPPFNIVSHIEMNKYAAETLKTREIFYYLQQKNKLDKYYRYLEGSITKEELYSSIPCDVTSKILNAEINEKSLDDLFKQIDLLLNKQQVHGIIGGPPCQSFSTMGRSINSQKKENDVRIYLYKHYIKFLLKYNPDFFIFENVKGLLSFKDQYNEVLLDKILLEFNHAGYEVSYKLIDSSFYGVPQKRERLFIFGQKKLWNNTNIFKSMESYLMNPIFVKELFDDLPDLLSGDVNDRYKSMVTSNFVKSYIRSNECPLTLHKSRKNNAVDLEIYKQVAQLKTLGRQLKYSDLPKHLRKHNNSHGFLDRYKAINYNSISHTIMAHISKDGHYYIHPDMNQNRSISIREAARIQTFPDDYYFEGPNTAKFVQIGNAVPPLLASKIAQSIIESLYDK